MATMTAPIPTDQKIIPGGSFLITDPTPADCFFPEDFTDEQKQIAETTANFASNEIVPASDQIEAKDFSVYEAAAEGGGRAWADGGRYSRGVWRAGDG